MKEKFYMNAEFKEYYESYHNFERFWNECPRGDWMLWISFKLGVNDRLLTLAKGHCANTVRHLMKDKRSIAAVDAAIRYGNGEIDMNQLNVYVKDAADASADAADASADAADASADASVANDNTYENTYAAESAADAAESACTIVHYFFEPYAAASYACTAAYCAHSRCSANDANYAKRSNMQETANICRKYLTEEVFKLKRIL